ncbi:hypothetical protein [Streptomyces sp. TRM64462]|uniref:hypothetical protein n=1 Tax=Streptomyces sp. TRM64462 TaxID=2741726 RepID=UPI00158650FD|nr:hypothetical protein [Streptomyces sp. TRM64462]
MSIIPMFLRLLLDLFRPGPGRRRAGRRPVGAVRAVGVPADAGAPSWLPLHRSPYGRGGVLDGRDSALVRPYLGAAEVAL